LLGFEIVRAERCHRRDFEAEGYDVPPPQPGDEDQPVMTSADCTIHRLGQAIKEAQQAQRTIKDFLADYPSLGEEGGAG
jgi:hypothetical protein